MGSVWEAAMNWITSEPPKDREFLGFAAPLDIPEMVDPARVVVAWDRNAEEWRPVKVPGDAITGIKLRITCWAELPEPPKMCFT